MEKRWDRCCWKETICDAIVTINDITAIGVINYLYSEGIQVPHDISIMGLMIFLSVNGDSSSFHDPSAGV